MRLPNSLSKLIEEFSKLPGIGPKSAQRLALYLLKKEQYELDNLSNAVKLVNEDIHYCKTCHNMSEGEYCSVCSDPLRDKALICVVEETFDALALDKTKDFKGVFHILGGVLNPLEGIGPDQLYIKDLIERIDDINARELIIATNPTLEGETTALHLSKLLKDRDVKITRIARGLPMGGDLEYADELTLSRALEGRQEF